MSTFRQERAERLGHFACDEEREIETIISVVPYELSEQQFQALIQKKDYTLFSRVVAADLKPGKEGGFELHFEGKNLLRLPDKSPKKLDNLDFKKSDKIRTGLFVKKYIIILLTHNLITFFK